MSKSGTKTDMPTGYKRARKTPERPLGFIAGDWIIVPLVTTGYAAGYVTESGKSFLLVHWLPRRFPDPPKSEHLLAIESDAFQLPCRIEPASFGFGSVWRLTPATGYPRELPRPLTYYHEFSAHDFRYVMHDFPESSLEWNSQTRCTSKPEIGAGTMWGGPLSVLSSQLDRILPDRSAQIPQGIWIAMPLTRTRWGVANVLSAGGQGVCLIALHTDVLREYPTAETVRSSLNSGDYRLVRSWDDQFFGGCWVEIPETRRIVDPRLNLSRLPEFVEIENVHFKVASPFEVDVPATRASSLRENFATPNFAMSWWTWREMIVEEGPKGNLERLVLLDSLQLPAAQPVAAKPKKRRLVGQEGDWFSFPLRSGGFGVARIARVIDDRLFVYYMDRRFLTPPSLKDVDHLRPADVIHMEQETSWDFRRVSALKIGKNEWRREEWPMPPLFRGHFSLRGFPVEMLDTEPGIPRDDQGELLWSQEQVQAWMYLGEPQYTSHGPMHSLVDSLIDPFPDDLAKWNENHLPKVLLDRYRIEDRRDDVPVAKVGDWFATRLRYEGGWAIGRVLHVVGHLALTWYFPPRLPEPILATDSRPGPDDRILAKVIEIKNWDDERVFLQNEPLWFGFKVDLPQSANIWWGVPHKARAWKFTYSLKDLNTVVRAEQCSIDDARSIGWRLWSNPASGVDNALTRIETGRDVPRLRRLLDS